MATEKTNNGKNYEVTFSPKDKQLIEIEKWLLAEKRKTDTGFYCNWKSIKSSYNKNELATISFKNKAIGFATWQLTTDKTAKIEITEIKPSFRKKGIGRELITQLINFLKNKDVFVIELQCSPKNSEYFWKRLGFEEFPEPLENYNFNQDYNKPLYYILKEYLQTSSVKSEGETIELWNNEPHKAKDTIPSYIWNIKFIDGTRILSKPIIKPAHNEWRLRWRINGNTIKDGRIKYFKSEIDFATFIIINELIF